MKTMILSLALLVTSVTRAQNTNPTNNAEMTFVSDTHDYGTLIQGDDGNCEFTFTNTGKGPLVISNAVGSCGCTIPDWPKHPIKPGEKAVIKVHYNTQKTGVINKFVTLYANVEGGSQKIYIKGEVQAAGAVPQRNDNSKAPTEK